MRQADAHRHRPLVPDQVLEGDAFEELHRDVEVPSVSPKSWVRRTFRLRDPARELDLLLEALEHRRVLVEHLSPEDLERDHLVELAIASAIDDAHPALAHVPMIS
jgi:hypothetical protein